MKNNKQNGYALLITVVIISIILIIATGLSSATTKQLILSSSAKDSETAFYQADTASECALYADYKGKVFNKEYGATGELISTTLLPTFNCGSQNMIVAGSSDDYTIMPSDENSNSPCFRISVLRNGATTINASGYNICDKSNIRTVERTIQISY